MVECGNDAVFAGEIAKKYGAEGGYKLVNAVLDSAARDLRGPKKSE